MIFLKKHIILLFIVCISSKISNYKWYTTINFIRNWTFNLFLPNAFSSQANLYSLMARPSFYEKLQFNFAWRSNFNYIVPVFCLHVQFLSLIFLWITNQIFYLSQIVWVILLFHTKNNCYLFDRFLFCFWDSKNHCIVFPLIIYALIKSITDIFLYL